MVRITQIAGAVAVIVALAIYVYFVVWQRASGYETAFAAAFYAVLLCTLGLIGMIGATIALRRQRTSLQDVGLLPGVNEYLPPAPPDPLRPHPLNAPGPFYVIDGCCTACGVPEAIAPDLYAYDESHHCYVRRPPKTSDELERALRVIQTQELGCVRYRGTDEEIRRRLTEAGESEQYDL